MKRKKTDQLPKFISDLKFKKTMLICVYILISICILYNVIYQLHYAITKNEYLNIFGISIVNCKNDFIIAEEKDKFEEEEIIVYKANNDTHISKVYRVQNKEYIVKNDDNYYPEIDPVALSQIIGKVNVQIPILGILIAILQSEITTIFIMIFLILKFSYNNYIYRKQRKRKKAKAENSRFLD